MPSTHTTRNRLEKQGTGENSNTWGTRLNEKTFDLVDTALDGLVAGESDMSAICVVIAALIALTPGGQLPGGMADCPV